MHDLVTELVVGDLGVLGVGDGVEQQLDPDALLGRLGQLGVDLLLGLVLGGQVVLQGGADPLELVGHRLLATLDLVLDDAFGSRDLGRVDQLLERLVTGRVDLLDLLHLGEPLAQVALELLEGVELARQLGELVVDLGELLVLDAAHGHLHLGVLAGEVAAHELGGEVGVGAGDQADQHLVQPGEQLLAAHLVGDVGGRTPGDLLAVDGRVQVELDVVALLGRAVHRLERGETLAQAVDLLVDLAVADLDRRHGDRDGRQVGDRELGTDVDLGGELQRLVVAELGDLHLGAAERLDVVLAHRGQDLLRNRLLHGLVQHGAAADPLVDDGRGDLAATEARYLNLRADLPVRLLQARLELVERHLDGELHPGRAQSLDGALHRRTPCCFRFW